MWLGDIMVDIIGIASVWCCLSENVISYLIVLLLKINVLNIRINEKKAFVTDKFSTDALRELHHVWLFCRTNKFNKKLSKLETHK